MTEYARFFENVTGNAPFHYQQRIGEAERLPAYVDAPTGAGKTAAVLVSWLWQRRTRPSQTSRRLVYCLPMRVLVDQIAGQARIWCERAGHDPSRSVRVLRGGWLEEDWEGWPEREVVLVGTQDQLLSRALNRGFAMSRFRWPMHYGLLHNDAWWVFDEVQLMGPGLRCGAQLEGARQRLGTYGPTGSTFMSATLQPDWTRTPDLRAHDGEHVSVTGADANSEILTKRRQASKPLAQCPHSDVKPVASWVATQHRPGTLTLVVLNQVRRAQAVGRALEKLGHSPTILHSRMRPAERRRAEDLLAAPPSTEGQIVVATQTVEAGVDISSELLVTDLAPWPSLVQRFGRCNRRGEQSQARVFWIDRDIDKDAQTRPYRPEELAAARGRLQTLDDARIDTLPAVEVVREESDLPRLRDIQDLFDTDADLDGNFIDISRWIRGAGDTDVAVYWRDVAGAPGLDQPAPHADELCPVGVHAFRDFVREKGKGPVFWFDPLEKRWRRAHTNRRAAAPGFITAGQRYLIPASRGGYDPRYGWDGKTPSTAELVRPAGEVPEMAYGDDPRSQNAFVSLATHLADTAAQATSLCSAIALLDQEHEDAVVEAAGYHDVGKAHDVFQKAVRGPRPGNLLAKAPSFDAYQRRGFRHELVSALVAVDDARSDLVAYLVAAHHGKVRRSIRPFRWSDEKVDAAIRGVRGDDAVPAVQTPTGATPRLDALLVDDLAQLGRGRAGASWSDRVERLLEALGPFRLAYLETLVRAADWRSSAEPSATLEAPDA